MMIHRRSLLIGLIAAPMVIRTPGLLMPVRKLKLKSKWEIIWRDATGQIVHRQTWEESTKVFDHTFTATSTSWYTPEAWRNDQPTIINLHDPIPVVNGMNVNLQARIQKI